MQQANLSERNAFCRFILGTSMTAHGIAKVARNPDCTKGKLLICFGAMKMGEGIFKYCPTKALFNSNMQSSMCTTMQSMFNGQNSMSSEDVSELMKDFSSVFSSNNTNTATKETSDATQKKQNTSDNKNSTNTAQNPS